LATALGTGLIAAAVASRANLAAEINASARSTAGRGALVRWGLSTVQVSISLSLVAGALLLSRTLRNYAAVPLGFDPRDVSDFAIEAGSSQGYTAAQTRAYETALLEQARSLAGVQHAALSTQVPFLAVSNQERIRRTDGPAAGQAPISVVSNDVTGEYFATLGIPLLRGAPFGPADSWPDSGSAVGKVILSRRLAQRLFGGEEPVGRGIEFSGYRRKRSATVVGVAGDVHENDLSREPDPLLYQPLGQGWSLHRVQLVVRSRTPEAALTRNIGEAGRRIDAAIPITPWGPLSESISAQLSTQTVLLRLLSLLSTLTLALTAVGLSALIAYGVTMRTREFGIRMALGATHPDIVRTAVRPVVGIAVAGIAGGVLGTLYLTRFIAVWLYGVGRNDPLTFVVSAGVMAGAVLLAAWIPARRAARMDPMVALRTE
jgi:predicted permease